MLNSESKQIVEQLIAATSQKGLQWQDTADYDSFRVVLPYAVIRISSEVDEEEHRIYVLVIMDPSGKDLERLFGIDGEDHDLLKRLFDAARRSARKVDDVLGKIRHDLQKLIKS